MEIKVKVFEDDSCYDIPEKASDFIAFFNDKLELIPEEHRHTAKIELSAQSCYDSASLEVEIYYYRPETDIEINTRLEKERNQYAQQQSNKLAQFERLRRELGL